MAGYPLSPAPRGWSCAHQRRSDDPVRDEPWAFPSSAATAHRCRAGIAQGRGLLAAMVVALLSRRSLDRCRQGLSGRAEGPDLYRDRRNCRGTDDLAARTDRRHAQLGLSLLLAARRHLHPAGPDEFGLL